MKIMKKWFWPPLGIKCLLSYCFARSQQLSMKGHLAKSQDLASPNQIALMVPISLLQSSCAWIKWNYRIICWCVVLWRASAKYKVMGQVLETAWNQSHVLQLHKIVLIHCQITMPQVHFWSFHIDDAKFANTQETSWRWWHRITWHRKQ